VSKGLATGSTSATANLRAAVPPRGAIRSAAPGQQRATAALPTLTAGFIQKEEAHL
jgi:hypothetical protein